MTSSPLIERLEAASERWSLNANLESDIAEAAALIRELVEALEAVNFCGNGGARLSRSASDLVRQALSRAKATSND